MVDGIYRETNFAPREVVLSRDSDGTIFLNSPIKLETYERSLCEYLRTWASDEPDRIFLAQRSNQGSWETITYSRTWALVQSVGQYFLDIELGQGRPIAILTGNSIEHAVMMLAGLAVGVPVAPISPNYSFMSGGLEKLREIGAVLCPALVFSQDAKKTATARSLPEFNSVPWVSVVPDPKCISFEEICLTKTTAAFLDAFAAVGPDTVAKILFTSGSTGKPKGVINTQKMLCASVAMSALVAPAVSDPVQVEWMPWHHTMGGNATLNSILKNGGTLYIDDGRPTQEGFAKSIENIKAISPTSIQTVPAGFTQLIAALRSDAGFRQSFFLRISRVSYGGSAVADGQIDIFQEIALATIGKKIPVMSGYGATETAPTVCVTHWPSEHAGEIGLPVPGVTLKLLPLDDQRFELRVAGPNVTPGYLNSPELTKAAFDEDGYFRLGDAVAFTDPTKPEMGLKFVGRVSENFKLATGTWVLVGMVRLALIHAASPTLLDVVVAGENHEEVAILAWPNPKVPDEILSDPSSKNDPDKLAMDEGLRSFVRDALKNYNRSQGSSGRVAAFMLLSEPPSLAAGEITDKTYINQKAVLERRKILVDQLFTKSAISSVVRV
ncbi:AMP-binding protein [Afipia sp. DC4300-2b1]|uniref:AMP-binding protein n=1 Tax=Afipia sp. DC4300-2b1 TaxID=2804672 RepID=UPI003CF63606